MSYVKSRLHRLGHNTHLLMHALVRLHEYLADPLEKHGWGVHGACVRPTHVELLAPINLEVVRRIGAEMHDVAQRPHDHGGLVLMKEDHVILPLAIADFTEVRTHHVKHFGVAHGFGKGVHIYVGTTIDNGVLVVKVVASTTTDGDVAWHVDSALHVVNNEAEPITRSARRLDMETMITQIGNDAALEVDAPNSPVVAMVVGIKDEFPVMPSFREAMHHLPHYPRHVGTVIHDVLHSGCGNVEQSAWSFLRVQWKGSVQLFIKCLVTAPSTAPPLHLLWATEDTRRDPAQM